MNAFRRLLEYLAFTKNEQKVFLFLTVVLLAGVAVKAYKAYIAPPERTMFDYTRADSLFLARSSVAADDSAGMAAAPAVIELNSASKEQLMSLPGIGEAMAERIMLHRQEKGPFRRVEELRKVKGIGEKKFAQLKPHIEVK